MVVRKNRAKVKVQGTRLMKWWNIPDQMEMDRTISGKWTVYPPMQQTRVGVQERMVNNQDKHIGTLGWAKHSGGLQCVQGAAGRKHETIEVVSDGSVKDNLYRGTWAWALVRRDKNNRPYKLGIEATGKESIGGVTQIGKNIDLHTKELHSYRMEAMALLSGLNYLRRVIQWEGTVTWHTDSQAVIDTYQNKPLMKHTSAWAKQRDKDV